MVAIIADPIVASREIARRRASGLDRHDEVWEGVYFMAPLPNYEHQSFVGRLNTVIDICVGILGLGDVLPGLNVSDRHENWTDNYRCPDVSVYLTDNPAENYGAHCVGGPDFAIEVVSPDNRSYDKLDFYAQVGTRELLIIDRDPWQITLFRLSAGKLAEAGRSVASRPDILASQVIPLSFRLAFQKKMPAVEVIHHDGAQKWLVTPPQQRRGKK